MKDRLFNVLAWAGFLALCVGAAPAVLIYSFAGFQEWNHERVGPDFFTETCDYWVKNPPPTSIVIPRQLSGSGEAETHYYDIEEFDPETCSYSAWGKATLWLTNKTPEVTFMTIPAYSKWSGESGPHCLINVFLSAMKALLHLQF